jgi:dimethylargininase
MLIAITHLPSPSMEAGLRTHRPREAIDHALALRQHQAYCSTLREFGAVVDTLNVNSHLPDCAFVEDAAIVLDEVAILTSMGSKARRAELAGIEPALKKYRQVERIETPATIEGGDVLRVGRSLLVGLSSRTSRAGLQALGSIVARFEYELIGVPVNGCLHLKTACTALPDQSLLVNASWLDPHALIGFDLVPVPDEEPWAANVLSIGKNVCLAGEHVRTADSLRTRGFNVRSLDLSEFAKAEGGVTCLSILIAGQ